MIEILAREFVYLRYYLAIQFEQIFVYWVLGILVGSFISVFLKGHIHRLMARMKHLRLGVLGVVPASLLGIASPLCMFGTIPLVASFANEDMREDWIAAFMMSSILLNPQLLVYTGMLGTDAVWVRLITCAVGGILAGVLVHLCFRDRRFFSFSKLSDTANRDTDKNPLLRYAKNVWRNVRATGPYFLLGIVLTALYQRYVPSEWTTALFGGNRRWGVFMASTLGVPMYVCGGGTIPLIAQWMRQGMSMGAAASFMLTGPATKLSNLSAVKIVLGGKHFALYLLYAAAFAFAAGTVVDMLFA